MAVADWPSELADIWQAHQHIAHDPVDVTEQVNGLIALIAGMYRDEDVDVLARDYVQTCDDRPGWACAGRAVWALGLWRRGEEDAALLQLILAELQLQEEMRSPTQEPPGGPTGAGAASNNLGVAYAAMEMFELAEPHLERASELSQRDYGPALKLQVCADMANLAEVRVRWALYCLAVAGGGATVDLASRARVDAQRFDAYAATIGREDARRYARMLRVAVDTIECPESVGPQQRDDLLRSLSLPVFGDEPAEVLMRAVAARVCRIVGDAPGCWEQAARVSALNPAAYHASTIIALHEAALAEGAGGHTWAFAHVVAAQSEATRQRIMTAFRARLGLAGLEQRYEEVSRESRALRFALQEALRQEAELVHAATHDSLTGLPNRALFEQHLASALQAQATVGDAAVVYVDVDDFKDVNDTYGHAAGDRVLRWLADRLRAVAGDQDTVARLGGDEFGVLLPSVPDGTGQWWREEFLEELRRGGPPFGVTVSLGLCMIPASGATVEQVLHLADSQMYEAKRRRKAGG